MTVVPLTADRFDDFISLINALADYERLSRPDVAAIERLHRDALGSTAAIRGRAGGECDWRGRRLRHVVPHVFHVCR
jgi:hypothetical protein